MKKGRYQSNQPNPNYRTWIIVLLLILIIMTGFLIIVLLKPAPIKAELPNGQQAENTKNIEKNTDSIAIPGYEAITLKADTKQQSIGLPNPPQNTCYFQITLMLEDGRILWESDLVKPGDISTPIILTQPLQKGTYPNAILKYNCYTMDGTMTALNSAATKLMLHVG